MNTLNKGKIDKKKNFWKVLKMFEIWADEQMLT